MAKLRKTSKKTPARTKLLFILGLFGILILLFTIANSSNVFTFNSSAAVNGSTVQRCLLLKGGMDKAQEIIDKEDRGSQRAQDQRRKLQSDYDSLNCDAILYGTADPRKEGDQEGKKSAKPTPTKPTVDCRKTSSSVRSPHMNCPVGSYCNASTGECNGSYVPNCEIVGGRCESACATGESKVGPYKGTCWSNTSPLCCVAKKDDSSQTDYGTGYTGTVKGGGGSRGTLQE